MEVKRILVLCGGKFALPTLQLLGVEKFLCGIAVGKGDTDFTERLSEEAENGGLAFKSFPDKQSLTALRSWIDEVQPDYIFSISFPFLLTEEVLDYGQDKFINFHPGPLPNYRGPMPLFEVLRYMEKETAISVHYMNEEFDEGDLILSESIPLTENETYGELAMKLSDRTAYVALNVAQMLMFASVVPRTAQDLSAARYFEKPEQTDTLIQWKRMSSEEIVALIHACNPWNQGADTWLMGRNLKLLSARQSEDSHNDVPGKILRLTDDGSLAISCMDGKIIEIQVVAGDFGILPVNRLSTLKNIVGQQFN